MIAKIPSKRRDKKSSFRDLTNYCLGITGHIKADAKENLKVSYDFTEEQAEAIVTLQLYRLTNTDVVVLQEEIENEYDKIKQEIGDLAKSDEDVGANCSRLISLG